MTVRCYLPTKKALKEKIGQPTWKGRFEETSAHGPEIPAPGESGRFAINGPGVKRKYHAYVYVKDGVITKVD